MSSSTTTGESKGEWTLFRYSNDPFVNEGAVEIGRQLAVEGVARIDRHAVVATAPPDQVLPKLRAELFGSDGVVTNTHRRSSRAYHVNALATGTLPDGEQDDVAPDWLGEEANGKGIAAASQPFPSDGDEDATPYPDDFLSDEALGEFGLGADAISLKEDIAYRLHPAYLGNTQWIGYKGALRRAKSYLDILEDALINDVENTTDEGSCMCCGSSLPNWKWSVPDEENIDIEYGQSFTPLTTKMARAKPLGQKPGGSSYYRGRCLACLLAGFYYLGMPEKPVASGGDLGVYRIFTPEGDFKSIESIRHAYEQTAGLTNLSTPTSTGKARRSSFSVQSAIPEVQSLAFFATLHRALAEGSEDSIEELLGGSGNGSGDASGSLSGAISFRSRTDKGPSNNVRGLSDFREAPVTAEIYNRLRERTRETSDGIDHYAPYDGVLTWYFGIQKPSTNAEIAVDAKRDLAQGIFAGNLQLLERGLFGLYKSLVSGAYPPYRMSITRHKHYFTKIMENMATNIDEETREEIQKAGNSVGQIFSDKNDLSVLQSFHHANTPDQFLSAFEKAGMGAAKKGYDSESTSGYTPRVQNQTAGGLIAAISDEDTFEAAKQMFVIHMSLSAHYSNSQSNNEDAEDN